MKKKETKMATTDVDEQRWKDRETILQIISDFREMSPNEASALQVFRALLRECNLGYQQGFIKEVLQGVCNEARRSGLLVNPNPFTREIYSRDPGNTDHMRPSVRGWCRIQGILRRHLHNAVVHEEMLESNGWSTAGSRRLPARSVGRLGRL